MDAARELRKIRWLLGIVVLGLVLSGVTAFPLTWEVGLLVNAVDGVGMAEQTGLANWLRRVHAGLVENDARFPFIAYGTDWLAFAHLVIALAFWGPIREPVRNKWVVAWGMWCCVLIVPLAVVCGRVRGIPWGWTAVDCAFGVVGIVPLVLAWRGIERFERAGLGKV